MTDNQIKEIKESMQKAAQKALKSKKAAKKFLREAGIPVGDEPFGAVNNKPSHA